MSDKCAVCGVNALSVTDIRVCKECEYDFRSRGIRGTKPLEVAAWAAARCKGVVAKKILGLEAENAVLNEKVAKHQMVTDTVAIIASKNEEIVSFQAEIAELEAKNAELRRELEAQQAVNEYLREEQGG